MFIVDLDIFVDSFNPNNRYINSLHVTPTGRYLMIQINIGTSSIPKFLPIVSHLVDLQTNDTYKVSATYSTAWVITGLETNPEILQAIEQMIANTINSE